MLTTPVSRQYNPYNMSLRSPISITDGEYLTAGNIKPPLFPTLSCYNKMVRVVWSASKKARAGIWSDEIWQNESACIIKSLESVGCRIEVTGLRKAQALGTPCVYIANHMSTLETMALPAFLLPIGPVTFIIKESLRDYPVFGHIIRASNTITVTRKDPRRDLRDVLEKGTDNLKNGGRSIIVFPQTTRALIFDRTHFNSIGVKLAKRAGVPVVPVALKTDAWGIGWPIKDIGPIHPEHTIRFAFGEPMEITGNGREQHDKTVEFIESMAGKWSAESA